MGKGGPQGALAMAARSASQDAKRLAKQKKKEQVESDDDEEEDNQEEEDEASPSNSEVEKSAMQNQKIAELRIQSQEEEKTQQHLEAKLPT